MRYLILLMLAGCAGSSEVAGGAVDGVVDAAPKALEELATGNWGSAVVTIASAAAGGGLLAWLGLRKKKAKNAQGG